MSKFFNDTMQGLLEAVEIENGEVARNIAWDYALGMIKADGLTPSDEMLELIEMEKRGEITTDDIIKRLKEKYSTSRKQA